ncbi:hypothetical protein [Peribacillus butanolivorans]
MIIFTIIKRTWPFQFQLSSYFALIGRSHITISAPNQNAHRPVFSAIDLFELAGSVNSPRLEKNEIAFPVRRTLLEAIVNPLALIALPSNSVVPVFILSVVPVTKSLPVDLSKFFLSQYGNFCAGCGF